MAVASGSGLVVHVTGRCPQQGGQSTRARMCPNFGLSGPADFCSDFARPRRAVLAGLVAFKDRREDFAARLLGAAAAADAVRGSPGIFRRTPAVLLGAADDYDDAVRAHSQPLAESQFLHPANLAGNRAPACPRFIRAEHFVKLSYRVASP